MKTNHFFLSYAGNKRREVKEIYSKFESLQENVNIIVEPFCGSSAFSYYVSTLHPKQYKYILNDNNKYLIDLYNIANDDDETKLIELVERLNNAIIDLDKEKYNKIIKIDTLEGWIIKHKIYSIRAGLFPTTKTVLKSFDCLLKCPMMNFLKNEDITFLNEDAIKVYEEYKGNDKCFIFLDPPYLNSCNQFYSTPSTNIYEYLFNNKISNEKAFICLCLEKIWIIDLLFKDYNITSYDKKYQVSKKTTEHIVIINKLLI
jgi:site-specific DNA-adenine methylase